MNDIGSIGKEQKNVQQGFKFRGVDDLLNALYPVLCKHGVFLTTKVIHNKSELKDVVRSSGKSGVDKHVSIIMEYSFVAEDGSSVTSSMPAEGLDSGDKATNKALSAAIKYALIQTFSIPTQDTEEGDRTTIEMGVEATTANTTTSNNITPTAVAANGTTKPSQFKKSTPPKAETNGNKVASTW